MSERVCKQILCSVLLGAVFSSSGYSSTTVAVIASQGIVLGADQKAVARCDAPCPPGMELPRVVFVQDRVVMGTVGLYAVVGYSHFVAPYYFPSLVGRIKTD